MKRFIAPFIRLPRLSSLRCKGDSLLAPIYFSLLVLAGQIAMQQTVALGQGPALTPWPMQGINPQRTSASALLGPDQLHLRRTSGTVWVDGVAIGTKAIYVCSDYGLTAIAFDGSLLWKMQDFETNLQTPAVAADETVYVGTSQGFLLAVNANLPGAYIDDLHNLQKGIKWSYSTGAIESSPLLQSDGSVVVATHAATVVKLSAAGEPMWTFRTGAENESEPAVGPDGTIYVGSDDDHIYAIAQSGTLKWKYRASGDVNGGPVVGSSLVYFTTNDFKLWAVDPAASDRKRLKWRASMGKDSWNFCASRPACTANMVVSGGADGVYAFNASTGAPLWKVATARKVDSQPAIDGQNRVYAHCYDGLRIIAGSNGQVLAMHDVGTKPGTTEPAIDLDGTLYVGGVGLHTFNNDAAGQPSITIFWLAPVTQSGQPTYWQSGQPTYLGQVITTVLAAVTRVEYFLDDGDGVFTATDELVFSDVDGSDGWDYLVPADVAPGIYRFFAVAHDDITGVSSNVVSTTYTVPTP